MDVFEFTYVSGPLTTVTEQLTKLSASGWEVVHINSHYSETSGASGMRTPVLAYGMAVLRRKQRTGDAPSAATRT